MSGDPERAYELYLQGIELLEHGSPEAALPVLEESLNESPHGATARRLALALEALGRQAAADVYWRRGFELAPRSDAVAVGFAGALVRAGETALARGILREVLTRSASYGPAKRLITRLGAAEA